jgi:very-short-patch-repair endonuclease
MSDRDASSTEAPPDDAPLYALLQEQAWCEALRWLHRAWQRLDGDARARRAAEVFDEAFFADLAARHAEALAQRNQAAGNDEAVRTLGRLATGDSRRVSLCAEGSREQFEVDGVRITRIGPQRGVADARNSLFKSEQERVFFEALRTAFPTHLVYPNAALNAVLNYERLQKKITQAERDYFFRALIDAVVVDPLDDLRPVFFFELDSAHHDTPEARRKDRLKDAILAKAGQHLFRLRPCDSEAGYAAFAQAIRAAVRGAPFAKQDESRQ